MLVYINQFRTRLTNQSVNNFLFRKIRASYGFEYLIFEFEKNEIKI